MSAVTMLPIIAAAHARRMQEITDAFRLADATAPERARTLVDLGLTPDAGIEELSRAGVLIPDPGTDRWYLSEAGVVAHRDAETARPVLVFVLVLAAVALVVLAIILLQQDP